jgi:succinate dehydrogenase / fumarate reductase cytochrome b subunit
MEIFVLLLPILYHAIYGLFIASYARNNTMSYNYSRNNLFMWQRATGVVVLLFLLYHVWQFRITAFWTGHATTEGVADRLTELPIFIFYVIGVVAAGFHLGNGVWTFLITWGITIGQRAQRISQVVTTGLSLLVSAAGVAILVAFVVQGGGFR